MKLTPVSAGIAAAVIVITLAIIVMSLSLPVDANRQDASWRLNEHGRTIDIDIDICIRCTSDVPGPPGPQGPQVEWTPLFGNAFSII